MALPINKILFKQFLKRSVIKVILYEQILSNLTI